MRLTTGLIIVLLQSLCFSGCNSQDTLWIYSSIRHSSEDSLKQAFARQFPSTQIKWYSAGSEKIAQTLEAERATSSERADLVVTADPFWFFANKKKGLFRPYESAANRSKLASLNDPEHNFAAVRLMTFAIAYNPKKITAADAPHSWKDLLLPKWKGKISIPNPLESGTTFAFVALISKLYGKEYIEALKRNEVEVGTTSDTILARMAAGDRPIGVLLIEDALRAKRNGQSVQSIYPEDGAIAIPGYVAVLKSTKVPPVALQAYDFFFSDTVQAIFLENGMHSPLNPMTAPAGAKPWSQIHWQNVEWSEAWLSDIVTSREEIKKSFTALFLER